MEELEKNRDLLYVMSRVAAVLVGLLLAAFFFVTTRNMATVSSQVEEMRDGPFPASIAAGHIETDIAQVETLCTHITNLNNMPSNVPELRQHFLEINDNMRLQLSRIDPKDLVNPTQVYTLQSEYNTLFTRLTHVLNLIQDEGVTNAEVDEYVNNQIMPVANDTLKLANDILKETTQKVDTTSTVVTRACTQTIWFSCVLIFCVILMLGLYMLTLHRKNQQEERLRKHLENALVLAQSANEAKSDFLSNMSHDIRTPMNAIIGLTTIANDNIDDKLRVKQCLTRIMTSSKHLLSLINDVLDMNKIESGKTTLSDERFSLPNLVDELMTIAQPQAMDKHLDTDVIISNVYHEELIGDAMRLRQILLNLISNAVKYTNDGDSVRVILTEEAPTERGIANIQFIVEDTGIGMDVDFIKHVFEPFEREHNDYTVFTEGTGLGMAITKNLVDLMGGTIKVKSEPNVGSKFTVRIPFKVKANEEPLDTTGFDALHILIVDDNRLVMENANHTLTEFGVHTEGLTNGADAPQVVASARAVGHPFDMVIVDLDMPDISNDEVIMRIHAAAGDAVPLVVVASYGNGHEESYDAADVTAAVTKPLFRSRLYCLVKRLCIEGEATVKPAVKESAAVTGRVLLVDDNEINLEIGMELISKLGPHVEGAHDGLEALAKISDAPDGYYGLVFMDCKMPNMDGFETTTAIRRFIKERGRSHLPIVAMTANAFDEDREHALAVGMDGFMAKPIDMNELEENLRQHLSS